MVSALSQEARLQAELLGDTTLEMTPELEALIDEDPRLDKLFAAQQSIFHADREMVNGQVKILGERKLQLEEQLNGYGARRTAYEEQLRLLKEQLDNLDKLYKQGLVTATRMAALRQSESGILGNLGALDSSLANVHQRMA